MNTRDAIAEIAMELEAEVSDQPFLIVNEAEFQAYLQARLLARFPEELDLRLADGVVQRRPGQRLKCRRVYREAKIRPGKTGKEPDLLLLRQAPQAILPKQNGAPSRFETPYDAIIETKMDASPSQVFSGHEGSALSERLILDDKEKWASPQEASKVFNVIFTAAPEKYASFEDIITVRRPLSKEPPRQAPASATEAACGAFETTLDVLHQAFETEPFRFLREKDFETALFTQMRSAVEVQENELHPVRCQWWSAWPDILGRRRRHDIVVLGSPNDRVALELELKTSHSDHHNWYRTKALKDEFEAMSILTQGDVIQRAVFLMFRFGPEKWRQDALSICNDFPLVEFDQRCSESA